MTGFNVNCKDCEYCRTVCSLYNDNGEGIDYFCLITGDSVDIEYNTDCCDYEPIRTTNDE